jgi:hypothetical protein
MESTDSSLLSLMLIIPYAFYKIIVTKPLAESGEREELIMAIIDAMFRC